MIDTTLMEKVLRMALYLRQPGRGLLHHSDRGSQYASHQILDILATNQVLVNMSGKRDCYHNAVMESFSGALKTNGSMTWNIKFDPSRVQTYSIILKGFTMRSGCLQAWVIYHRLISMPSIRITLNSVSKKSGEVQTIFIVILYSYQFAGMRAFPSVQGCSNKAF